MYSWLVFCTQITKSSTQNTKFQEFIFFNYHSHFANVGTKSVPSSGKWFVPSRASIPLVATTVTQNFNSRGLTCTVMKRVLVNVCLVLFRPCSNCAKFVNSVVIIFSFLIFRLGKLFIFCFLTLFAKEFRWVYDFFTYMEKERIM